MTRLSLLDSRFLHCLSKGEIDDAVPGVLNLRYISPFYGETELNPTEKVMIHVYDLAAENNLRKKEENIFETLYIDGVVPRFNVAGKEPDGSPTLYDTRFFKRKCSIKELVWHIENDLPGSPMYRSKCVSRNVVGTQCQGKRGRFWDSPR